MSTKIIPAVTGMTCDGCERHVRDALVATGLTDVDVAWRRGLAAGVDTGSFDIAKTTAILSGSGYEITSVTRPAGDSPSPASGVPAEYI